MLEAQYSSRRALYRQARFQVSQQYFLHRRMRVGRSRNALTWLERSDDRPRLARIFEAMFDPLLVQMKAIYDRPEGSSEFAGALLRPMAEGVKEMLKAGETGLVESVFLAAKEAGRQLVKEGRISEETQKAVSKELMPRDAYYKAAQEMMEQAKKEME